MFSTVSWTKIAGFYRDEERRITVALESPRYFDAKGELCPSDTWIYYRDHVGFREGEFETAELAMAAADAR